MALIDSSISHDKFVLINNMVKSIWGYERGNQNFKDTNSYSNVLVYL